MYFVFDVVYLDGDDLTGVPLMDRKRALAGFVPSTGPIQMVGYFEKDGELLFEKAVEQGFEGIVAKRKDSIYEAGKPSRNWLKAKSTITDQFVVCGYVWSEKMHSVGGLIVGRLEDEKLRYSGSVGTGLGQAERKALGVRLAALRVDRALFNEEISTDGAPVWVKPEIVVEVRFTQWTHAGYLREPVFSRILN